MPKEKLPRRPRKTKRIGSSTIDANQAISTSTEVDDDSAPSESQRKRESDDAYLESARNLFHAIADDPDNTRIRHDALEDLKFYNNDQWPEDTKQRLQARRRPVLTINRVKPAVRQVVNSILQDRPSIKINPADDKADVRTAQILDGLIRHIEVQSMADVAYDCAINPQCIHGTGYVRVITRYPTPFSTSQEAFIVPVEDPFTWYLGPHKELEDLNDAFAIYDYTPEQYEQEFGGSKENGEPISAYAGLNDFTSIGNVQRGWGDKNTIRVCEHYQRTFKKAKILWDNENHVYLADQISDELRPMIGIVGERDTEIPEVKWRKFNAVEILDETIHPGAYIPVVPVYGDKQIVDGQTYTSGIIRDAKDAQKQYNYFRSKMTETVALAPSAPWIMAEGQDENHESEWDSANVENYSVLRYKPKSISGHLAPAPERNLTSVDLTSFVVASRQYEEDIQATTQVRDAQYGAKSNEVSGVAQRTRISQGQTGNFTFANNFSRALRYLGMILLDLICGDGVTRKGIYDARTVARIIGEDNQAQRVQVINDPTQPAYQEQNTEEGGLESIYNLGVGQYDVAIGIGPSYLSKQQEAFDMLTKIVNSYPQMMQFAGDVIMRNSGIPDANILADRLKRFIEITMPGVIEDEKQQAIPVKVQQAIKELTTQHEQLTQLVQQQQQIIDQKKIENEAKVQIEGMKQQGVLQVEAMKAASQEYINSLKGEVSLAVAAMKEQSSELLSRLSIIDTLVANLTKPGPVGSNA